MTRVERNTRLRRLIGLGWVRHMQRHGVGPHLDDADLHQLRLMRDAMRLAMLVDELIPDQDTTL